ncbi:response regulator transcription factor [Pseudogemmobacter faecipullorum]|uniref:Response regulator transcription factor n=1 Tax=Pseudogemmobacter faecipullorum TaxID=2755041 RepID=A0ABS8CIP9_9RHOB|nr:response regulator transcription factor [Pseudogemmobacter faecipullorum]MCB5409226.1 response regulator transcription factor [Pseudogemmobacter faecipullorum]
MAHILVIEDDPDIASLLQRGLGAAGHQVAWVETAAAALQHISSQGCDAAIIDMMLGEESGADLLAGLRAQGHRMPAIMLSALSRVEDRSDGLAAGAQDYVVKPFTLTELLARLEVQLRLTTPRETRLMLGGLIYDPRLRNVTSAGPPGPARSVLLTEREGDLLACMMAAPGEVLTRGALFDAVWASHGGSTENVVDVYLGYLRRKLGNFTPYGLSLRTLRGKGFILSLAEA